MAFVATALHQFVSGFADAGDASLLQPSNWNATHTVSYTGVVSGGIQYGTSTTTVDYSALLASGGVVLGGGAGAAPYTSAGFDYDGTTFTQRNGTTAQALQVYNTFTSSTNYERGVIDWVTTSNTLLIGFQKGSGGGTDRNVRFMRGNNSRHDFSNANGFVTVSFDDAANRYNFYSAAPITFANGDASSTAPDLGISRISAGLLGVGTGAAASFAGRIKATSGIVAAVAVGALNATPTVGEIQTVNDALAPVAGAAVAAGGAANALVWWNGAQWTVVQV